MTTISAQVAQAEQAKKRQALSEYRELIKCFRNANKNDGVRMLGLCAALGISISEVEGDARAYQQMLAFDERASEWDLAELDKRCKSLGAEVRTAKELPLARMAMKFGSRYEPELRGLIRRQVTAVHKLGLARAAETSAAKLRADHPRVFGPTADDEVNDGSIQDGK